MNALAIAIVVASVAYLVGIRQRHRYRMEELAEEECADIRRRVTDHNLSMERVQAVRRSNSEYLDRVQRLQDDESDEPWKRS